MYSLRPLRLVQGNFHPCYGLLVVLQPCCSTGQKVRYICHDVERWDTGSLFGCDAVVLLAPTTSNSWMVWVQSHFTVYNTDVHSKWAADLCLYKGSVSDVHQRAKAELKTAQGDCTGRHGAACLLC